MMTYIDKLNKLSLSATILIGCVILGAFYFFSETNKQNSIERQQQMKLQAEADVIQKERERDAWDKLEKSRCATEAETSAQAQYEKTCTYDCKEGFYYTANYDNYYNVCLQRKGLI